MAAASPTPFVFGNNGFPPRPTSRHYTLSRPQRPHLRRASPLSTLSTANDAATTSERQYVMGDSSDDEGSAPALSAEAEAILRVNPIPKQGRTSPHENFALNGNEVNNELMAKGRIIPQPRPTVQDRTNPPATFRSVSPRIVRLDPISGTLRRAASTRNLYPSQSPANTRSPVNTVTPVARVGEENHPLSERDSSSTTSGTRETMPVRHAAIDSVSSAPSTAAREHSTSVHETVARMENLALSKNKADDTGFQGSLRIKRVGKVTGRYLSGPARRGMIRRQSEEDQSPKQEEAVPALDKDQADSDNPEVFEGRDLDGNQKELLHENEPQPNSVQHHDPHHIKFASQAQVLDDMDVQNKEQPPESSAQHANDVRVKYTPSSSTSNDSSAKRLQPIFKVPPLPTLPSKFDQENEPPPTFKRNKVNGHSLLEQARKVYVLSDDKMLANTPATASPPRKALAPRSQNTPHRPAPPPPKMTVLETATANAGAASASQSKKRRNYISVNGKLFTRMDCIGRGGSAKVYRVMAENYKVFALKRVSLEDIDEPAVRGYKGEIDLLRKLENVDRVVRLFDWEINDERQTLSVLMEMGESDLNRVLTLQLGAENARFDISFTRYFWKEMLECVQAVHEHDIVHSDLKPANFLLVQGRLKLIDFGIANAIQDDTINVHREQHIGTPNYMSPEALVDLNAQNGLPSSVGKMMKLGKPSDVWSLGCILYQMVYGKPPFAHIANWNQRVMAIPNPSHIIEFPEHGVGGVSVPAGLIRTLRRCLNRDLFARPTVEELLTEGDPFLHPDTVLPGTILVDQKVIRRLQENIIKHIREKGIPTNEELSSWPGMFYTSIKAAVEDGRA
ncbi:Dual-specificity kinase, spindle pole body (SPB) duplication and spindle checkpoint function [Schaereria dolodes]|nr:Dual-specificity kinase, spindle pole body (SPB) duplication and spindle checkpoint function [Schaereria dolodes]